MVFIQRAFKLLTISVIIIESLGMRINPGGFECTDHIDCPDSKPACFDSVCMNLCEGGCGINAICQLRERVTPVCYCPSGMIGDPFVKCWTPQVQLTSCETRSDCLDNKYYCEKNKCVNHCENCGENALCSIYLTKPSCNCPENMTGDPYVSCKELIHSNTGVEATNKKDAEDKNVLVNSINKLTNSTNRIANALEKLLLEFKYIAAVK